MSNKPHYNIEPWKVMSSSTALDNNWFRVKKDKVKLPTGTVIDDYFLWESPNIATVAPLTPDNKFVICEQYRHAIKKVMLQFPAGGIGKTEFPEEAAKRELEEETGYTAGRLTYLSTIASYPTKLTGLHYLFLAQDVKLDGEKLEDENEITNVHLKTPSQLVKLINNDEFQVADSITAALLTLKKLGL